MEIPKNGILEEKGKITIWDHWETCCVCGKAPTKIFFATTLTKIYYYCTTCNIKDYKPKTIWQKINWFFNKFFI